MKGRIPKANIPKVEIPPPVKIHQSMSYQHCRFTKKNTFRPLNNYNYENTY